MTAGLWQVIVAWLLVASGALPELRVALLAYVAHFVNEVLAVTVTAGCLTGGEVDRGALQLL